MWKKRLTTPCSAKHPTTGRVVRADGNLVVEATIYDQFLERLIAEGGHLANDEEKAKILAVYWEEGHRTMDTIACPPQKIAQIAGFSIPDDRKFIIVKEDHIGKDHLFSSEKLGTLLAIFKYKRLRERAGHGSPDL